MSGGASVLSPYWFIANQNMQILEAATKGFSDLNTNHWLNYNVNDEGANCSISTSNDVCNIIPLE